MFDFSAWISSSDVHNVQPEININNININIVFTKYVVKTVKIVIQLFWLLIHLNHVKLYVVLLFYQNCLINFISVFRTSCKL